MLNIIFWLCLIFTSAALVYIRGILNHEDNAKKIEAYTESLAKENLEKLASNNLAMNVSLRDKEIRTSRSAYAFITLEEDKNVMRSHKSAQDRGTVNLDSYKLEAFPLSDVPEERFPIGQLHCA